MVAAALAVLLVVATGADALELCRLAYPAIGKNRQVGWQNDFPRADRNLALRFSELTTADVTMTAGEWPYPIVLTVTINEAGEQDLSRCPLLYAQDVWRLGLNETGTRRLRDHLAKGGILWVDDSWVDSRRQDFLEVLWTICPGCYVAPFPEAARRALYWLPDPIPRLVDIETWQRRVETEGGTDDAPRYEVVRTPGGDVAAVLTWNTDVGDGWEREAASPEYFREVSPLAYAIGINLLLYAMSH